MSDNEPDWGSVGACASYLQTIAENAAHLQYLMRLPRAAVYEDVIELLGRLPRDNFYSDLIDVLELIATTLGQIRDGQS